MCVVSMFLEGMCGQNAHICWEEKCENQIIRGVTFSECGEKEVQVIFSSLSPLML